MTDKRLTKGSGDIVSGQLSGGELIEQGLELGIVVFVNERDPYVIALCQLAGASEASKAPTHNYDMLF